MQPIVGMLLLWPSLSALTVCGIFYSEWRQQTSGEIVLEETPFCPFFVVRTNRGHTLATAQREDVALLGGYQAKGPLQRRGFASLDVQTNGRVRVLIEDTGVSAQEAVRAFEARCPDASVPLMVLRGARGPRLVGD